MKNMTKIAGAAVVALTLAQSIQAVPIQGAIGFGGNVSWDTSSAATATAVTAWSNTRVLSDSLDFATFITPVAAATFNNSVVWNLNDIATTINNFWTAGGFTFTLNSSFILSQGGVPTTNGFVVVNGVGVVSGNGFSDTLMNWSFTAQDPKTQSNPDLWTFSASTTSPPLTVPDGGSTVMLLGIALSGAALLKRKFMA